MREFFGIGGYQRVPEGYMSWQHLTFVTSLMIIMIALAIIFGKKNNKRTQREKNGPLVFCAFAINAVEIFKIVMLCVAESDPLGWLYELPLFLCSIQLIAIPLAAFSGGKLREAALDFVSVFGVLGAILGTYAAGQNYACYPVLSIQNVASGITHSISGFAALYIIISGMASMKKSNISITYSILTGFCILAHSANMALDYNYMFLVRGDGTPYDIVYNFVGGNPILYPLSVVLLFIIYITVFYWIFNLVRNKIANKAKATEKAEEKELVLK